MDISGCVKSAERKLRESNMGRGAKEKNRYKNIIIFFVVLIISIAISFFNLFRYLENRIYAKNYEDFPGNCGQFVNMGDCKLL